MDGGITLSALEGQLEQLTADLEEADESELQRKSAEREARLWPERRGMIRLGTATAEPTEPAATDTADVAAVDTQHRAREMWASAEENLGHHGAGAAALTATLGGLLGKTAGTPRDDDAEQLLRDQLSLAEAEMLRTMSQLEGSAHVLRSSRPAPRQAAPVAPVEPLVASTAVATVKRKWVFHHDSAEAKEAGISYGHMLNLERFQSGGKTVLAAAWQASAAGCEGVPGQHIRFSRSFDDGENWFASIVPMWGLAPLWSPILHWCSHSSRLFLFFSESRKAMSPGGDIKLIISDTAGLTWGEPTVLLTHEADGGVPKVLANKLCVMADGRWLLPFWREPLNSWLEYSDYHPLQENDCLHGGQREPAVSAAPASAAPESRSNAASTLISTDRGRSWRVGGDVSHPTGLTWLIEVRALTCMRRTFAFVSDMLWSESHALRSILVQNTLCETEPGRLLMLFRSGVGSVFASESSDGGETWTDPSPTPLPNPNSKVGMVRLPAIAASAPTLALAYNPSTMARAPLMLALSTDGGRAFADVAVLESDPAGNYACKTTSNPHHFVISRDNSDDCCRL